MATERISANSIKLGAILVIEGQLWKVIKAPEHVKPGKGPAYVQLEMKNVKTGTKKNERLSSSEYMDKAFLEQREVQYLYQDGEDLVLMDVENYEQMYVSKTLIENDKLLLLKDNMLLKIEMFGSEVINLELPPSLVVEVIDAEPGIKGATAASSYKSAVVTNGVKVRVPPYINSGEKIVIKTEDLSFVERHKN